MSDRAIGALGFHLVAPPALAVAVLLLAAVGDDAAGATSAVGRSTEGRAITVTRVGPRWAPTPVLVVGSIHGDEPGGLAISRRLVRRAPPRGVEFWVVPTINPDGVARGTRQNARGVDLNRNFPFRWRRQGSAGTTFYSGPRPASEIETRLAVRLIRRVTPAVTIWFHQPFGLVDAGSGADRSLVPLYARASGLPARRIGTYLPGIATRWQTRTISGTTAFVVELPPGPVSAAAASRHVRAVRLVAGAAAANDRRLASSMARRDSNL